MSEYWVGVIAGLVVGAPVGAFLVLLFDELRRVRGGRHG